jgi:rSAM/selenodomain-associated transferase 1
MGNRYEILDPSSATITTTTTCALAVMAKAPRTGDVKTRLVPPLEHEEAAALNVCFLCDVTAVIAELCVPGEADGFAAYMPAGAEAAFDNLLPPRFRLLVQRGANLGERLFHAAEDFFAAGYQAMCLINSDSPTLPPAVLRDAVEALRAPGDRMVLGPADDGGYYLIGLKQAHRRLFQEIAWSTPKVLASTLDRAREIGLESTLLPSWYDVDDATSLHRLCQELFPTPLTSSTNDLRGYAAPRTREFLRKLIKADEGKRLGLKVPVRAACS